jgi:DNA polymerase V
MLGLAAAGAGEIAAIQAVEARTKLVVPLVGGLAPCGFPSPADDYLETPLDFNDLLIRNPPATFVVKLDSTSMIGAGLFPGDLAIVDRSIEPTNGCITLVLIDGEFTVKRYYRKATGIVLHAESPDFADILVGPNRAFEVWGVIKFTIRML